MPHDLFAINGRIVTADEAKVSVLDLGFLRGVGAFETLRTYGGGHPHALDDHLRRLWESSAAFGVEPFFAAADVRPIIAEIHRRSGHAELRVNIIVTPGENTSGVFGAEVPTWVLIAREVHAPSTGVYEHGVTAITFHARRHLPTLKTTNYLVGKTGLSLAEKNGAHEAFYVDDHGHVTEGVTSNIVIVRDNRVTTPSVDCLAGITMSGIRPIAEKMGLTWTCGALTRDDVYAADEVWITSAIRELIAVVKVDDHVIANGAPGHWARTIRPLYHAACIEQARHDAGSR
jgi:branched-subunit amino acid aminotransferase/4-amino-4-deoxychorismate lyase